MRVWLSSWRAMACAVPLIATDVASIPEITGPYAEMITPESHEDIFNSLDNIFQNYDYYTKKLIQDEITYYKTLVGQLLQTVI